MCLYKTIIRNKKYTSTQKNGGDIPPIRDPRVQWLPIGCGECMECVKQKQLAWQVRLLEEIRTAKNGKFVTLTFSTEQLWKLHNFELTPKRKRKQNPIIQRWRQLHGVKPKPSQHAKNLAKLKKSEGYDRDNAVAKLAVRFFLERWRKQFKKSVRHFLVTELGQKGETEHIHLHGIIWTNESYTTIRDVWQYGYIYPRNKEEEQKAYVDESTVNYIVKYISKKDLLHKHYKSIILTSAGMGSNYINRHDAKNNIYKGRDTRETYKTRTGHQINLPIYYRNKIYNDIQRENLWIYKLDKQEMWVAGIKIDVSNSKGVKSFYKLLDYYRRKSTGLGYGNGQRNWKQAQYEHERRKLINEQRFKQLTQQQKQTPAKLTHRKPVPQ